MLTGLSPRTQRGVIAGCAAVGVIGLHGGAALFFASHDPYTSTVFLPCPFLFLTGWQCPGCGGTRAAYSLFNGDIAGAWRMNPLVILGYPIGAMFSANILATWAARPRLAMVFLRIALAALLGVAAYNWMVRNVIAALGG